jgi:hypothetical protein
MPEEKHWIFDVPILKGIALTLLFIHVIGIPYLYCLRYANGFFNNVDLIRVLIATTAAGSVFTCGFGILIGLTSLILNKELRENKLKFFEEVLINLIISYCALDLALLISFSSNNDLLEIKNYILCFIGSQIGLLGSTAFKMRGNRKKEAEELPPTSE